MTKLAYSHKGIRSRTAYDDDDDDDEFIRVPAASKGCYARCELIPGS